MMLLHQPGCRSRRCRPHTAVPSAVVVFVDFELGSLFLLHPRRLFRVSK
jgi:hypothetical protein